MNSSLAAGLKRILQSLRTVFAGGDEYWKWLYRVFETGDSANYPSVPAQDYGVILRPGEKCYVAIREVVHGKGIQVSQRQILGFRVGGATLGHDSTSHSSSIKYDKRHRGTLLVCSKRIFFISVPKVFLEVPAADIRSVAWSNDYVLLNVKDDLLAFRIPAESGFPVDVLAVALHRVAADQGVR